MQDPYTGKAGRFVVDPIGGVRVPAGQMPTEADTSPQVKEPNPEAEQEEAE